MTGDNLKTASREQDIADLVYSYFSGFRPNDYQVQAECKAMLSALERTKDIEHVLVRPIVSRWDSCYPEVPALIADELIIALAYMLQDVTAIIEARNEKINIFETKKKLTQRERMRAKLKVIDGGLK